MSNPLAPSATSFAAPELNIIDASKDLQSTSAVSLVGAVVNVGSMALSPDGSVTLVTSPTDASVAIVDNVQEATRSTVNLPGPTKSAFVWIDNQTAFAAIPSAPVTSSQGASPGAVVAISLSNSSVSAIIPVAGAQYVVDSHNGNRILAFGVNPQSVTIINQSQIGTSNDPRTVITSASFDHPVWGVFSTDDSVAYIVNCGAECGGVAASVAVLDMTQSPPQVTGMIPVPGATYALLNGATLYVAGTSSAGGTLSVISITSNTATNTASISDGYHDRMALTANGQLFIGARNCSAGCLSIFNTSSSKVVIPSTSGDVTGIQPITGRTVVYVCENGSLTIYDTTTDAPQPTQVDIVGQAVDVELVDTP